MVVRNDGKYLYLIFLTNLEIILQFTGFQGYLSRPWYSFVPSSPLLPINHWLLSYSKGFLKWQLSSLVLKVALAECVCVCARARVCVYNQTLSMKGSTGFTFWHKCCLIGDQSQTVHRMATMSSSGLGHCHLPWLSGDLSESHGSQRDFFFF